MVVFFGRCCVRSGRSVGRRACVWCIYPCGVVFARFWAFCGFGGYFLVFAILSVLGAFPCVVGGMAFLAYLR